ncbi:hypothetical protein COY62_03900 [bacterium (Candidatus Howlettbacteria) CG_4_10_14_0_8_um_filter_40_9]|nr:MAG: hypothetical protein COY62_03900 [bacterium (Candidatus Howlettbacteria) CG_4_10_14_0_8_um_filter_40_9]
MNNSYKELKKITDSYYSGQIEYFSPLVLGLLLEYKIKPRQKDGNLHSVQISIPKSKPDSIVVGLRYFKKDKTNSEDHFLFEKGFGIKKCYGKKLEELLTEYKGTHKTQLKSSEEVKLRKV